MQIINELNEKFGFNFKKDNSTFQKRQILNINCIAKM